MELAIRQGPKDFVADLAKCTQRDSLVSTTIEAEWQRTNDGTSRMYDPKKGGRYEIFNERPLHPDIVRYCAGGVSLLPGLYKTYQSKLNQRGENFWRTEVEKATRDRTGLSQSRAMPGRQGTRLVGHGMSRILTGLGMSEMKMYCEMPFIKIKGNGSRHRSRVGNGDNSW